MKPHAVSGKLLIEQWRPHTAQFTESAVDRRTYTDTLVPQFAVKVPGAGSIKWLNIAALARFKTV